MAAGETFKNSGLTRRALIGAGAAMALGAASERRSRLILLGTAGGPTPKPNRAASAQVIVIDGLSYVIDCGNGVARQMILAGLKLGSINSIFITHHHSDHNADFGNLLLLAWASDLSHEVNCYGPPPLADMGQHFLALNETDIQIRTTDEGRKPLADLIKPHEISTPGFIMQDDRVKVTAALVNHPPVAPAFAYRFDTPDRSIVISGDTSASDHLIDLARGADILVHEVMHLPSIDRLISAEPNAPLLRAHLMAAHSTCEQAGRAAQAAGVKTLVLSHFVPGGLPAIPDSVWLEATKPYFDGTIIIGRDLMEI
jgi:ribonuclease BN (tRNA processing enzyme)